MTRYLTGKGEAYEKKLRLKLRIKAKESGVPIATIADRIRKSPASVYRYLSLKNKSPLPLEVVINILAAIGVDEAKFFSEVDEMS